MGEIREGSLGLIEQLYEVVVRGGLEYSVLWGGYIAGRVYIYRQSFNLYQVVVQLGGRGIKVKREYIVFVF